MTTPPTKTKNNATLISKSELGHKIYRLRHELLYGAGWNLANERRRQKLEKAMSKRVAAGVRIRILRGGAPGLKK